MQSAPTWAIRADRLATPLWTGLIAGALACCLFLFGPPGGDAATHLYQTQLFAHHGFQVWDNLWYSGTYSLVNYSLVYYPLAVAVGQAAVITAASAVAAGAFTRLVRTQWPTLATAPALAAMICIPLEVIAGVYPFLLGLAFGLLMLVALQARRPWLAAGLAVLTISSHVLAFAFVGLALLAWALADRTWLRDRQLLGFATAIVAVCALQLLLIRAFSLPGEQYIFDPKDFASIMIFCAAGMALTYRQPSQRPLWILFILYAAVTLVDFAVPNSVGGNAVRLLITLGLPILLIPLGARGFRPAWAAVACIVGVAVWQGISPVSEWLASASVQDAQASYWTPALAFLAAHADPDYRVEVVQSERYWEAYYIAGAGFAMARGWYRQADFPTNESLYGNLTPAIYRAWLRSVGVHYVLLSSAPLDFSSFQEAALLRSGRSGLRMIGHRGQWTIYALPHPTPIATPAQVGRITAITPTSVTIRATEPGPLTLRLHNTPYWSAAENGRPVCVDAASGTTTNIAVTHPGTIILRFGVGFDSLMRALLGSQVTCPASP